MTKYIYCLIVLIITLSACDNLNPGEKALADLVSKGGLLVENDSIKVAVGTELFYQFRYSAGVEPIYYDLAYTISDEALVEYNRKTAFYIGDEDMSGGPMVGIHVLKAKNKGSAKIEFYNKHFNQELLGETAPLQTVEEATLAFEKAYQIPQKDSINTEEAYEAALVSWNESFVEEIEPTIDSILKEQVKTYAFVNRTVLRSLVSLYEKPPFKQGETFEAAIAPLREGAPVHSKTGKTTLYVTIE